ncbi:hypothetical protein [Legionella spiritensis]|uniref:hypothetical protein n=1 Tax=Legionella spiritensis TaxID=452 RepID=UPI000F6C0778|nr:hypothetical protein [Legionella spiritensis]VEG92077.1 Ligand-gated ion channel [Legionella spiritensis]
MKPFRCLLTLLLWFLSVHLFAASAEKPAQGSLPLPEKPTYVEIGVYLNNIIKIDKQVNEQPKIYLTVSLQTQWQDAKIARKYATHNNPVKTVYDNDADKILNEIWTPDIVVPHAETTMKHTKLTIFPSGTVYLYREMELIIPLKLKLRLFPFDSQKINIRFIPKQWTTQDIILDENMVMTGYDKHITLAQWHVDMVFATVGTYKDPRYGLSQPSFDLVIYLKRIPSFFLFRIIVPLFFIILVACLSFLTFDEPTGTKLSRAVVFLLITVAFHSLASSFLPTISYLTFIESIILLCYLLVLAAIFQIIILHLLRFYNKSHIATRFEHRFALYAPITFVVVFIVIVLYYFLSY